MVTEIVGSSRYKLTKTTLGILNVETSDGGGYICEVISSLGKDQAEILLTVNGTRVLFCNFEIPYKTKLPFVLILEPLQIDIKPKLHTARANEHVAFICELTGGSTHSFTWLHNGRIIPSATGSSLSISNVEAKDSGMYQCFAKLNKKALQATAELRLSGLCATCAVYDIIVKENFKLYFQDFLQNFCRRFKR